VKSGKAAMAIYPSVCAGFAPTGFFISATQLFGYDTFIFYARQILWPDSSFYRNGLPDIGFSSGNS
jgi:hypothetical protein